MCSDANLLSHLHHEWKMHFRQFGGQKSLGQPEKPLEIDIMSFARIKNNLHHDWIGGALIVKTFFSRPLFHKKFNPLCIFFRV